MIQLLQDIWLVSHVSVVLNPLSSTDIPVPQELGEGHDPRGSTFLPLCLLRARVVSFEPKPLGTAYIASQNGEMREHPP